MQRSDSLSEVNQSSPVSPPVPSSGDTGGAPKKAHRRSLKQAPPAQNGQQQFANDVAAIARWVASLQAAMPATAEAASRPRTSDSGNSPQVRGISPEAARVLVRAIHHDEWRRVPKSADKKTKRPAESCPTTGLNRNQFYELFDLREMGKPVIKNVSLKKAREKGGARLYNVGSVVDYLDRLAEIQAQEE